MVTPRDAHRQALPLGLELHWYVIDDILGQGAFGITYLARDINLDRRVAVKEFFPGSLAARGANHTVDAVSDEHLEEYRWGLRRFINEAQTLAKFEHPNIVRVHNVFEANQTAYMVMQYEQGHSLDEILKAQGTLGEKEILQLVFPLMSGLEAIHEAGFIHRDVKPANIFLRVDSTPVLLDFGSARQALHNRARTLTNLVSPGYAPIEQYTGKSDKQGPWSDIYGLGATLYRAATGQAPADAVERGESIAHDQADTFQRGVERAGGRYRALLLQTIDHALEFRIQERPQSIAEWRREFAFVVESEGDTERVRPGDKPALLPARAEPVTARTEPVTQPYTEPTVPLGEDRVPPTVDLAERGAVGIKKRRPRGPFRAVLASAGLAVVAAVWWAATGPGTPEAPTVAAPLPAPHAIATGPVETPTTVDEALPAATAEPATPGAAPTTQERVEMLLRAAAQDLAALRLTTPNDHNAHDKYREVLRLAPDNDAARHGMQAIADRYLQLAYRDIEGGRFARAGSYLDKSEQLAPGREALGEARAALAAAARTGHDEKTGTSFADKIEGFGKRFDNFVKEQKGAEPDGARGDAFLRQLGR